MVAAHIASVLLALIVFVVRMVFGVDLVFGLLMASKYSLELTPQFLHRSKFVPNLPTTVIKGSTKEV